MQCNTNPEDKKRRWTTLFPDVLLPLFTAVVSGGMVAGFFALELVDQRFQTISGAKYNIMNAFAGIAVMVAVLLIEVLILRKSSVACAGKRVFFANLPILFWGVGWIFPLHYFLFPLYIFFGAWSFARFASMVELPHPAWNTVFIFTGSAALAAGIAGGWWQIWSFNHLGMQWFDWGHFYEVLINTLNGRFFYLDIENGCFLASRFCISLLVLLPVAMLKSPEIFLLTGALLVASGGIITALGAKILKLPPFMSLLCGISFILLPGSINMMFACLDGFHEVFLLIPAILGAWCCYRAGWKKSAVVLWIFSLGIRETVGIMWVMWGIFLMLKKSSRRDGIILFSVSLLWTILLILVVMPGMSTLSDEYIHKVFFSHLGNSMLEIALSPVLKPSVFWGTLFSLHNINYLLGLSIAFIPVVIIAPRYLPVLLPDLVMIMLDHRFDSQNLLRHYQIVPMLVLVICSVEVLAEIYHDERSEKYRFLRKIAGIKPVAGIGSYMFCGIFLSCCCFGQLPILPSGDTRLLQWSDVRGAIGEFYKLVEPGIPVTAGPGMACYFAGRNDLSVYHHFGNYKIHDHVIIESFMEVYGENALRYELLKSGRYEVRHSVCLDERLLQLLVRKKDGDFSVTVPESIQNISDAQWNSWGMRVPCKIPQLDIRGKMAGKTLLIAVRVKEKVDNDFAFRVNLEFKDSSPLSFFRPFGDGVYPAYLARENDVWIMAMELDEMPSVCRVDQLILSVKPTDMYGRKLKN